MCPGCFVAVMKGRCSTQRDLLARVAEARAEFERAATLTRNARERAHLLARTSRVHRQSPGNRGV